jgi:hypothetical protein
MFIRLGSSYINTQSIVEIRMREGHTRGDNATVFLQDGTSRPGFLTEEEAEHLCAHVLPAPVGHEVHRHYDIDFSDDFDDKIQWTPVIAFVFQPGVSYLIPITAEDGQIANFAVRQPNGRIYTSHEEFFDNADEYALNLRRAFEKARAEKTS